MIGSGLRNAVNKAFGWNAHSKDVLRDSLVPLNIFDTADIEIDLVYAQPNHKDNHFKGLYNPDASLMWVHKDLAKVVLLAARICKQRYGWTLKINDCLRPVEAQEVMRTYGYDKSLVSRPGQGAHPRAMAIDIEPMQDGKPVDMGTPFDEFAADPSENRAHRHWTRFEGSLQKNLDVWENRMRLEGAMRCAATALGVPEVWPLPQEWWDFRFPEKVFGLLKPLREADLYPWQRLIGLSKPDVAYTRRIAEGVVPPEIQPAVDEVFVALKGASLKGFSMRDFDVKEPVVVHHRSLDFH